MNRTDEFLKEIDDLANMPVPDKVIEKTKLQLLDYIGVTLAGAKQQKERILKSLDFEQDIGTSTIIGVTGNQTLKNAIFYNGLDAHTLDFDDGTNQGIIHLGSPIFSALLPIMEKCDLNGYDILRAAVIGYETSFTMAMSIQPEHKQLGYHATGTCGTLGVATAIAYALGFDEEQKRDAFNVAALSASGSLKVLEDGSVLKPYNAAKASLNGYVSAQMGMLGYSGPDDVLSGSNGFLHVMSGNSDNELTPVMLNGTYAVEKAYIKPYAACRYCHPAIEAAMNLRKKCKVPEEDIESITVKTYLMAVNNHDHTEIKGINSAKMSIPYSVAVAYITGKAGMEEYGMEWVSNKAVLKLTEKVKVIECPEYTNEYPKRTMAELELETKTGKCYREFSEYPKGEPENPMSMDDIKGKFFALGKAAGKGKNELQEIVDVVLDFENQSQKLSRLLV